VCLNRVHLGSESLMLQLGQRLEGAHSLQHRAAAVLGSCLLARKVINFLWHVPRVS
jgi:hypothetical protein